MWVNVTEETDNLCIFYLQNPKPHVTSGELGSWAWNSDSCCAEILWTL